MSKRSPLLAVLFLLFALTVGAISSEGKGKS